MNSERQVAKEQRDGLYCVPRFLTVYVFNDTADVQTFNLGRLTNNLPFDKVEGQISCRSNFIFHYQKAIEKTVITKTRHLVQSAIGFAVSRLQALRI